MSWPRRILEFDQRPTKKACPVEFPVADSQRVEVDGIMNALCVGK